MAFKSLLIQLELRIPLLFSVPARNMQAKLALFVSVVCSTLRNHWIRPDRDSGGIPTFLEWWRSELVGSEKRGYSMTTCGQRGIEGAVSMEHQAREGEGAGKNSRLQDFCRWRKEIYSLSYYYMQYIVFWQSDQWMIIYYYYLIQFLILNIFHFWNFYINTKALIQKRINNFHLSRFLNDYIFTYITLLCILQCIFNFTVSYSLKISFQLIAFLFLSLHGTNCGFITGWFGLNITRLVCFHAETQCQGVNGCSYCMRCTTQ